MADSVIPDAELLKYAIDSGMIDAALLQEKIEMQKREELLSKHTYEIWEGKDGYWRTYLPDEEKGRKLIKRRNENDIKDIVADYWADQLENPTVEEVFNEWNDRKLTLAKISNATHLRNKGFFKRHFAELGKKRIKSIGEDEWEDFLEEQIPKFNLKAKAFAGLKGVTKGMLKRAKKRKLINFNVEEMFSELDTSETDFRREVKEDYEEVFNEEETDIMVKYLIDHLDAPNIAILLMFVAGVRIGEVVTLKHSDFIDNTFNVRRTETKYKNDGDERYTVEVKEFPKTKAGFRTVIIPEDYKWLCEKIRFLNPFSEYIFVKDGERMTAQAIRMRLKRLNKKLNIYHKSPHKIRKTYGTILLDNNIDEKLILDQMGHANIGTTESHYHRNRRSITKKSAILSSIPDLMAR